MIGPASVADWLQASLVASLLGGLAAACGWALRQELRERLLTARSTTQATTASEPSLRGPAGATRERSAPDGVATGQTLQDHIG
jgi:hypothetical protein